MTKTFVCCKCEQPAEAVVEKDEVQSFRCPRCGHHAEDEEVQRIIHDHAMGFAEDEIRKALERTARGSKALTYKPGRKQHGRRGMFRLK